MPNEPGLMCAKGIFLAPLLGAPLFTAQRRIKPSEGSKGESEMAAKRMFMRQSPKPRAEGQARRAGKAVLCPAKLQPDNPHTAGY